MRTFLVFALLVGLAFAGWQLSRATGVQIMGAIVDRVETDQPRIALTFDDGPDGTHTREILEILAAHNAPATFFLNGEAMDRNPDDTAAIAAAGHEIGNHGHSHTRLVLRTPADIRDEITRTDAAIRTSGYSGPIHVRPPFGKKLFVLPYVLSRTERVTVMWSVTVPEGPDATPDAIARAVLDAAEHGAIVLLHPMFKANAATREALPAILTGLRGMGLELVTVSTLLSSTSDQ